MKTIKNLMLVLMGGLLGSCMDGDWDEPKNTENAFGNAAIEASNVVSIKDLKAQYSSTINSDYQLVQFKENTQIKAVVTGNDIGGNLYNQISVDDGTGAIIISIAQGGLFGYLPVGQELLIELKGLYIGGYGKQAQIGTPYTNKNGNTYVSRMSRALWNQHFKLVGQADASKVVPTEFDKNKVKDETYRQENCGKLMTISGVQFSGANGENAFAVSDSESNVNVSLSGFSSSDIVVRTSTYADFAAMPLPAGTGNLTGIFTRYRNTWQILLRSEADIDFAK